MPPAHKGIDGLWNCLRPILSSSASYNSCCLSRSLRTTVAHHQNPLPWPRQRKRQIFLQTRTFHRVIVDTKKRLKPSQLATVNRLYHELHRQYDLIDFLRIYEIVGELVGRHGEPPNARMFLALILANTNSQHGSTTEVTRLLQEMVDEGVEPDSNTYHAVLKVLAIHPDYLMRKGILEEMHKRWMSISNDGWHDIIAGLLRDRQLELAMDTFDFARKEGVRIQSWLQDMIVYILCDVEEFDEVLAIMRRRVSAGDLAISPTLWFYILDTASHALHHSATLYVWRKRVETSYLNPPSGVCTNILNTAARHGDFRLASDVCRVLGNRHGTLRLYHYESLLESYTMASDLKTALTILSVMTSSGVPPSVASTRPVYALLCREPSLIPTAVPILRRLDDLKRPIPVTAVNVVIEAFVTQRDLAAAMETYKSLHLFCPTGPVTATFNELFRGCLQPVRKDLAMFLASEMVALRIAPDALTYDRLVLVCLTAARHGAEDAYDDAWRYFEEMSGLGWWPRRGTTLLLVQAGSEKGDERVWKLADKEATPTGLGMAELESVVRQHWKGGEEGRREKEAEAEAEAEGRADVVTERE